MWNKEGLEFPFPDRYPVGRDDANQDNTGRSAYNLKMTNYIQRGTKSASMDAIKILECNEFPIYVKITKLKPMKSITETVAVPVSLLILSQQISNKKQQK